jgi:hypothetical protein
MEKKLAGYRQQDRKHEIYSEKHFVKAARVEELLAAAELKCLYCRQAMLRDFPARAPNQWTLDRIDNRMGHNDGNVVVCCLACNLQRRDRSLEKFKFTKQLAVVKLP